MPHVNPDDLPKTAPRKQAPIPKDKEPLSAKQSKAGLLGTLSMYEYKPSSDEVDKALGQHPLSNKGPNDGRPGM